MKQIFFAALLALSASINAQTFNAGQVLTAAQLNAAFTFTQSGTGSVSRPLRNKAGELVSINDTGAVVDGMTDDSAAVTQAATNAAMVLVPPGISVINPTVLAALQDKTFGPGFFKVAGSMLPAGDVHSDLTVYVPSQFSSIQGACNYLRARKISRNAWVTVKVADGTYSWSNIECAVPDGDRVSVIGNTAAPGSVVVNVNNANNANGFVFYRGSRLFLVDGMTINGTAGWQSHCTWAINTYGAAFAARDGGSGAQIGPNVRINKMYYGILADHSASFNAPSGGVIINEAGDAGVLARWGGSADIQNSTVTNACHIGGSDNLGFGFLAEVGGSIRVDGSTATGNNVAGFAAQSGGAAWAHGVTATSNTTYGVYANEGGVIEANQGVISGGSTGVQANNRGYVLAVGATASGASGSGMNATNGGVIDVGAGATANGNGNGFSQYNGSSIFGTMNGTGNTYALFVNGNAVAGTTLNHSQQEIDKSYTYSSPATGGTVTLASGTQTAIIAPAGALSALTVTLPACSSAYDGSIARYSSTQTITSLTVSATVGTVSNAPTTLSAGGGSAFICRGG